ncbi:SRPBCC family protein [Actinokineospora guangxiensis]|uniref:SRPBCC family protein n=1 Tax=Actinokineospora guangxiensis TaxID=1490288 RepID=A0ABW0ERX0_9PSEU
MIEVVRSAEFAAGPEQVWAVVADARRVPDWFSLAERTEVVSGAGEGEKRRQHADWGGKRAEIDQTVIAFEPGRLIAWKHTAERVDGLPAPKYAKSSVFRVELESAGTTTTVTLRLRQEPVSALHGIMMRFGTRQLVRRMEESLVRLAGAIDG